MEKEEQAETTGDQSVNGPVIILNLKPLFLEKSVLLQGERSDLGSRTTGTIESPCYVLSKTTGTHVPYYERKRHSL